MQGHFIHVMNMDNESLVAVAQEWPNTTSEEHGACLGPLQQAGRQPAYCINAHCKQVKMLQFQARPAQIPLGMVHIFTQSFHPLCPFKVCNTSSAVLITLKMVDEILPLAPKHSVPSNRINLEEIVQGDMTGKIETGLKRTCHKEYSEQVGLKWHT